MSKRFRILRRLGAGGMGVVYEAIDREHGTRVALKTLLTANADHLARLKREFRVMQEVRHPGIVGVRELLCEEGRWFLTMDLVEGTDFVTYVSREPPPPSALFSERRHDTESDPTLPSPELHGGGGDAATATPVEPNAPLARFGGEEPTFDEERLRAALLELTDGLLALHAAGLVHRDIKPSNVLVTKEGRVVLLDFGLVTDVLVQGQTLSPVGTPAYMAPEQAAGSEAIGPEADWYAVGVLLYDALTGCVPFEGAPMQVLLRKQTGVPNAPSVVGAGVPPDLDALCMALLRVAPGERPTGASVRRALGRGRGPEDAGAGLSRTMLPGFVGRERELGLLEEAFDDSRLDGCAVIVEGESGVGKSRLVRQFTEQLLLKDRSAIVLAGRCFERESVPYKALDGVVDALARRLSQMPRHDIASALPTHMGPLLQVFPVMQRVPTMPSVRLGHAPTLDPLELRSRAFTALRELLTRLGDRQTLVVVIDDAQWSDHDSYALLAELTREPDAPRMLIVATVRTAQRAPETDDPLAPLRRALGTAVRTARLGMLSESESLELVTQLVTSAGRSGAGPPSGRLAEIASVASEARGHPLFIDVLTRLSLAGRPPTARPFPVASSSESDARSPFLRDADGPVSSIEQALAAEVETLDAEPRAILETVAIADAPLKQRVVQRASGVAPHAFQDAVQRLRRARLVVTSGAPGEERAEPYHDRVRVSVVKVLAESHRVEVHRAIAEAAALESDADPEMLARHWRAAGETQRAADLSTLAGDRAVAALAFDRAARLYEQALELAEMPSDERRALYVKLGDALANAGRGEPSARAYGSAIPGASDVDVLELRRRAAIQLLRGGHWEQGLAAATAAFQSIGIALPRTAFQAVALLLLYRPVLRIRGLGFRERDATHVARSELTRIDTSTLVSLALGNVDVVRGMALQSRELVLALRCGEPVRVARAMAQETIALSVEGGPYWSRTGALLARVEPIAARTGDPYTIAMVTLARGVRAFLVGRFGEARDACDDAGARLRECPGAYWEVDVATRFALESRYHLGDLREVMRRFPVAIGEARARGNLFAWTSISMAAPGHAFLAADDAAYVRAQAREAMAAWSRKDFDLVHYYELWALTTVDLYDGAADDALARLAARWGALKGSLLLRVQFVRIVMWDCRGRAALAVATQKRGPEQRRLLRAALRDARRIEKEGMAWSTPWAKLVRAGVANVEGDAQSAVALLRAAVEGFEAQGKALEAAAARHALGALTLTTEEGAKLLARSDAYFREQAIQRPDRWMRLLAPGLPCLATPRTRSEEAELPVSTRHAPRPRTRFEEAIGASLATLDAETRRVAQAVALSEAPLKQRVALAAARIRPEVFADAVQRLRAAKLVVTNGPHPDDLIEPYHGRVRAAIVALLSEPRRVEWHRVLAESLAGEADADPEALAHHWRAAGDAAQASRFSVLAGDRAAHAAAFERAVSFYEEALAPRELPETERRALGMKLGEALACAGRGEQAARAFHAAAEGASSAQALDLRRRAAEQLLRSGHFDEGVAAIEEVLASVGLRLPKAPLACVLELLFFRLVLMARGLGFRERDAAQVSPQALARVDACWAVQEGLVLSDTVRGAALQARSVLAALRIGEPYRAARALGAETAYQSQAGGPVWARTARLIERARRAAELSDNLHAIGWAATSAGVAHYLAGRYRPALALCEEAVAKFRTYGRDNSWELASTEVFIVNSLAQLGELAALRERTTRTLEEATRRGDLHATVNLRIGYASLAWLVTDEPEATRRHIDDAMVQWSKRSFHLTHYYALFARTNLDLYAGEPRAALARVSEQWRALQRSLLPWKAQTVRIGAWCMRARAALGVAAFGGAEQQVLLRAASSDARRIERQGSTWTTALAKMLHAGIARVSGDAEGAVSFLREAASGFDATDMALHAIVARRALAGLVPDARESDALEARVGAWFRAQIVKRPSGWMAMIAPGLPLGDLRRLDPSLPLERI